MNTSSFATAIVVFFLTCLLAIVAGPFVFLFFLFLKYPELFVVAIMCILILLL